MWIAAALWTGVAYVCIGGAFALAVWLFEQSGQAVATESEQRMDAVAATHALIADHADSSADGRAPAAVYEPSPGTVEACGSVFTRTELAALARVRHSRVALARRRAMTVEEAR